MLKILQARLQQYVSYELPDVQAGFRWVITPSWLSGSWRSFLYSSSEYSCHLFLISSASVRSIPFLSFIEPIFAWNVPLISLIFWWDLYFFPILFFSSISLHWSLRKVFLPLLAILWNSAFRWDYLSFSLLLFAFLLFTAICKASPDSHFAFLHFFSMGMVLIPVSCTMSQTSVSVKTLQCHVKQQQVAICPHRLLLQWGIWRPELGERGPRLHVGYCGCTRNLEAPLSVLSRYSPSVGGRGSK